MKERGHVCVCVFVPDSSSVQGAQVRRPDGLCEAALQRVRDQRNLQRHRADTHERCVVFMVQFDVVQCHYSSHPDETTYRHGLSGIT